MATPKKAAPKKTTPKKTAPKKAAPKKVAPKKAAPKKAAPKKTAPKKTAPKKAAPKKTSATKPMAALDAPKKPRIFTITYASLHPLYVTKAVRKGRTKEEVDTVVTWLTGYDTAEIQRIIDAKIDLETFFARARMNPKASLITGVVCGVRVEEVTDPLMRKIRYLDKLVDELAKGKKLASILRE